MKKEEKTEVASVLEKYGIDFNRCIISRDKLGAVNKIYFVAVGKEKFVLRKSNAVTSRAHLNMEIAVLKYFKKINLI